VLLLVGCAVLMTLVELVDGRVPAASRDQPSVHRNRDDERDDEADGKAPPKQAG
jgi:hypothetical protein